jgi:NAD(P)-dependent dehydrogenase (short-subunit alcohol dehydrogenase family)
MPTTLVTGANRGLGLEFARQYAREGWQVIAGCRDPDRAAELQAVARQMGKVDIQSLNVVDGGSIAALARRLAGQPIDLLINNAGLGQRGGDQLGEIDYEAWLEVLSTNSLGPVRVTEALIENVAASGQKRVITISSGLGSLTLTAQGIGFGAAYQYRTSKAAVDMAMLVMAQQVKARGITVVLFSPGWVRTDMGGPNAQLSPEESISSMQRVIDGLTLEDSGRFLSYDGSEIAW